MSTSLDQYGWIPQFFYIESKLFQLVVEEGGSFFSLKIFERGIYFMQSVFMGKSTAIWHNLEHIVRSTPSNFSRSGNEILLTWCNGAPTCLVSIYQC